MPPRHALGPEMDKFRSSLLEVIAAGGVDPATVGFLIGCDIGGTNARIVMQLVPLAGGGSVLGSAGHNIPGVKSTRVLLTMLSELEAIVVSLGIPVLGGGIAVAGPIQGGVRCPAICNFDSGIHSTISKFELPAILFPPPSTRLLNGACSTCLRDLRLFVCTCCAFVWI